MNNNNEIVSRIFLSSYSDIHVIIAGYEKVSSQKPARKLDDFKAYSMHFILSGAGYLKIADKTLRIEKNQIFFLFPNTPVEYFPDKKMPWKYFWIDFIGAKASEFLERINVSPNNPVLKIEKPAVMNKIFVNNAADCLSYKGFSDVVATAAFYNILTELLKQQFSPHDAQPDNKAVNEALKYINANYANSNLDLNIVASRVGFHRVSLSRLLRQKTGLSFNDFLTKTRLHAAVTLFEKGETSISAVADAVGYADPLYFSKVFKKYNAISPREHIKKIAAQKNL